MRRVAGHNLAVHKPIEEMTDRSEPLLDARRRELARRRFDPCCHVHRLHVCDRPYAGRRAPRQKFLGRSVISPPCVRVADGGGEEFEEAHRRALAGRRHEQPARLAKQADKLVH